MSVEFNIILRDRSTSINTRPSKIEKTASSLNVNTASSSQINKYIVALVKANLPPKCPHPSTFFTSQEYYACKNEAMWKLPPTLMPTTILYESKPCHPLMPTTILHPQEFFATITGADSSSTDY